MHKFKMVLATIAYIEAHLTEKLDLDNVATAVHYSKYHLHRVFTEVVGITIHDYAQRRQLTEAAKLLAFSDKPILDIAMSAGYGSQQAFANVFKAMYKQSPHQFRESEGYYALQLEYKFGTTSTPGHEQQVKQREITFATEADIPEWMELTRLVVDGFPHFDEVEHRQNLRQHIGEQSALIMKERGKAIGTMMLCHNTGSIDFLGVHPLFRKQGINHMFLNRAFGELMQHKNIAITTFRAGDKADTGQRQAIKELGFVEAELLLEFGYPTQRMTLPNARGDGVE